MLPCFLRLLVGLLWVSGLLTAQASSLPIVPMLQPSGYHPLNAQTPTSDFIKAYNAN